MILVILISNMLYFFNRYGYPFNTLPIYNIPGHCANQLEPVLLAIIVGIEGVVYIKPYKTKQYETRQGKALRQSDKKGVSWFEKC